MAGGHVGSAADHGHRLRRAVINLSDMEVVGIRMRHTFKDFRHDNPGESAGNLLLFLHGINLDTNVRHRVSNLLRGQVKLEIIFQPIVRELHNYLFFNIFL